MNNTIQTPADSVPTKEDDIGAIPLEGSGFEDQQPEEADTEKESGE